MYEKNFILFKTLFWLPITWELVETSLYKHDKKVSFYPLTLFFFKGAQIGGESQISDPTVETTSVKRWIGEGKAHPLFFLLYKQFSQILGVNKRHTKISIILIWYPPFPYWQAERSVIKCQPSSNNLSTKGAYQPQPMKPSWAQTPSTIERSLTVRRWRQKIYPNQ